MATSKTQTPYVPKKDPKPVLKDDELYSTDNGRVLCGKHCGMSARFTRRDISGQRVRRLSAKDAAEIGVSCERCGAKGK